MIALAKNTHIYIELAVDRYAPCASGEPLCSIVRAVDRYAPLCERGAADMQLAVDRYAPYCASGEPLNVQ